uniref:Uncharacterized protein n=1 Tax=Arundo donax TaxID=35708 RepID=A0A0A9HV02_ARUDO
MYIEQKKRGGKEEGCAPHVWKIKTLKPALIHFVEDLPSGKEVMAVEAASPSSPAD